MSVENLVKDSRISLRFKVASVYQIETQSIYSNCNLQGISAKERIRKKLIYNILVVKTSLPCYVADFSKQKI